MAMNPRPARRRAAGRDPVRPALAVIAAPFVALVASVGCVPRGHEEPPAVVRYEAAAQRLESHLDAALVETAGPDCESACDLLRELGDRTAELCDAPTGTVPACARANDRLERRAREVEPHCLCIR